MQIKKNGIFLIKELEDSQCRWRTVVQSMEQE